MKQIHVLVLITQMDREGSGTIAMNYMRYIDRNIIKYDFVVNEPMEADYEKEIKLLGGKVYHMSPVRPGKIKEYVRQFREFLQQHPYYDIIHSYLEEKSFYALKVAAEMKMPVRICHGYSGRGRLDNELFTRYYLKYRMRKYCTHSLACSREVAEGLFGRRGADRSLIFKNSVDTGLFMKNSAEALRMRNELGLGDSLVVGHVGQFAREKNQKKLLEIFAQIHRRRPGSKLVMVGGGKSPREQNYKNKIMQRVKDMQLQDSVIFMGVRDDVYRVMQTFNVMVLPSVTEGFPLALVEAQSMGIRCVVSDEINPECNITGNVEFLPLALRSSMWADRIINLLESPFDDKSYLVRKKGYDIKSNALKLQEYYGEII